MDVDDPINVPSDSLADVTTLTQMDCVNAEFAKDAVVSEKVSGEAFGWNNTGYVMNDMVTTGQVRNRPVVTFTNNDASAVDVEVAIFIGAPA